MEKINNLSRLVTVEKTVVSHDGTAKFLLKLTDGNHIECVLLTQDYGKTVCISSQVGCKMACAFCASGSNGFVRNLTAHEMLAQVMTAKKYVGNDSPQTPRSNGLHVVIMGSGEPFDNYENVIEFLRIVDVGARKISVSTCGIPDKIRAFADTGTQVNLCISLHAPNDTIRKQIMPIANRYGMDEVLNAAKYFFDKTHRRVIFEYALIDGVNCMVEHARELCQKLRALKISAHVNLINMNEHPSSKLKPPTHERAKQFMDALIKGGVTCTMRKSRGADIAGACGQLVSQNGQKSDQK